MFGYYYRDPRRPDPGDLFGSFMTFLVILFIVIMLAVYFGGIILLIFLGIGVLIGGVCAIIAYINAFVDACKSLGNITGNSPIGTFFKKWWYLFKTSSLTAFKNNFSFAHNALIRAGGHKLLSFKKWMWFIVAPSVIIFGTAMIAVFALLQISLIGFVLYVIISLLLIVASIYFVIGLGYSFWKVGKETAFSFSLSNPFTSINFCRGYKISDFTFFVKNYFSSVIALIANIWKGSIALCSNNIASASGYPAINLVRFFLLFSPISIMFVTVLFIALIAIASIVVFIPLAIAKLFWCLLSLIIK